MRDVAQEPFSTLSCAQDKKKNPKRLSTGVERYTGYHCDKESAGLEPASPLEISTFCFPPSTQEPVA